MIERYGVSCIYLLPNYFNGYSKISQELFSDIYDALLESHIDYTYYAKKNKEFITNNSNGSYSYDFVITNIKFCIEFNGDLWHANPKFYKEDDTPNPFLKSRTAKEIWEYDREKIKFLQNMGYEVLIIWEHEFYKDKEKIIQNCLDRIYDRTIKFKNKISIVTRI